MKLLFLIFFILTTSLVQAIQKWPLNQVSEQQVLEIANDLLDLYKEELNTLTAPLEFSYAHEDYVPSPFVSSAEIVITEKWNQSTQSFKPYYKLHLLGVFTRISSMDTDGIALILCHELGHVFGGIPTVTQIFPGLDRALSVEGQSDYFAAQSCFKRYATHFEITDSKEVPPSVQEKCSAKYGANSNQGQICERNIMAGVTVLTSLNQLRTIQGKSPYPFSVEKKSTDNQSQYGATLFEHPDYQCRLDTYIAGALCDKQTCEDEDTKRPACWFVP